MRGISNLAVSVVVMGLLTLFADPVRALGLGEARVNSYLNQPLELRVRLLEASEAELDSLTIGTATPDDYQRLGLASNALALGLRFEVDRSRSPAVILIRSEQAVTDPILQILVDARWASGRLLREYTLFLDPPTLDIAPPMRSQPESEPEREPVQPSRAEPAASSRPARNERAQSEPAPSAPAPARARDGGERLVRAGDTLWSISMANLPVGEVSMDQMMLAIVDLNPEAFRNGNINQLLRGSRLTLPTAEQARGRDRQSARDTVLAQNRVFNQRPGGDVPVIADAARGAQTDAPEPESPGDPTPQAAADQAVAAREPEAEPEGRLELVPAGDDDSGTGLDGEDGEVSRLREQLARTEEELFTARLEAEDFQARLEDLEAMVARNPDGVGIADAELAGLEETLRAARMAAAEDADPAMRAEVTAELDEYLDRFESAAEPPADEMAMGDDAMAAADDSAATPDETVPDDGASEEGAEENAGEAVEQEEPVVTQVGSGGGSVMSNPLFWPIAGLIALLLALGGFWIALQRRRREAEEAPVVVRSRPEPAEPTMVMEDPVDRARAAVAERPDDLAAHLALLNALAGRDEQRAFDDALEHMFEHVESGDEPAWREAVELASTVSPEHVLVKGSADWMSGPGDLEGDPKDDLDEESEVGDLMSRLDAEQDEEPDDSDWRVDEDEQDEVVDTPMLRDQDDDEPLVLGGGLDEEHDDLDAQVESWDDSESDTAGKLRPDANESVEPDVPDEEAEDEWLGDSLAGDAEFDDATRRAGDGVEPEEPATPRLPEDDGGLLADWTDEEDASDAGSDDAQSGQGDDIFAPSDDDVDVKLDLARAYLSWNSTDSAKTLLEEVVREGNAEQKAEARKLLDDL